MESAATARLRVEDVSREDLMNMFIKLEEQKIAAEESFAQSNTEKEKIKEKALALLKRCRELESKQGEIDELRIKVVALESSSGAAQQQSPDSKMNDSAEEKLCLIITELQQRCKLLQASHDMKAAEATSATEEITNYKNQGNRRRDIEFTDRS
jgi:hypothetical protein